MRGAPLRKARGKLYFGSQNAAKNAVRFTSHGPYFNGEKPRLTVPYEREQIDSLLKRPFPPRADAGGLYLAPALPEYEVLFTAAIAPAMAANALRTTRPRRRSRPNRRWQRFAC